MTEEDIFQECVIIVMKSGCLEKYDTSLPLENFLTVHLRNRLYNFKRDNFARPTKPCLNCPLGAYLPPDGCSLFDKLDECSIYNRWNSANVNKKNIMNTISIHDVIDEKEGNMRYEPMLDEYIDDKDRSEFFLENLSIEGRKIYLKLLDSHKLSNEEIRVLSEEISELLGDLV
jgi:hypothetical protein